MTGQAMNLSVPVSGTPESTEFCRFEIHGFYAVYGRFLQGCAPAFLTSWKSDPMRSRPNRPDQDLFEQQPCRGRVDGPLNFWGRWFSNWQVPPVFTPPLRYSQTVATPQTRAGRIRGCGGGFQQHSE